MPIAILEDQFEHIHYIYVCVTHVISFPQVSAPKASMHLSVTLTCHIPGLSLYSCVNIWWEVEIMKLLLCNFLHFSLTSSLLNPNIILSTLFCNYLKPVTSFSVDDQVPHPYKTIGKIIFLYMSVLMFSEHKLEQKDSVPNNNKYCLTSVCA
jgi:hypothetical protein